MLSALRNSVFTRYVWGIMALYFINSSVDTVNVFHNNVPENLSYNDQESIIELIAEQVLGFSDAVPEYEDEDSEKRSQLEKKSSATVFVLQSGYNTFMTTPVLKQNKAMLYAYTTFSNPFMEIQSPPPEI